MMFGIEGKIALITGASGGLGAHFAKVLAEQGAHVILAARRTDKLQEQINLIKADGGQARSIELDVTSNDSVTAAFADIYATEKHLDILVNNAGVGDDPKKFLNTEEEDWSWQMQTNLDGAWRVAREAARLMVRTETFGSIINIASIYGFNTGAMKVAYNVSKAGVMQLTKSMSIELCRHKIRVNSLCPGWFLTDINREYFATESGERYVKGIPMRELGQFDDLNVPLLLLASNKAGRYMTGSSIVVDGGISETPI
jgi:NAD(P)-dependent dehydrogenase (short-subunit alcohol dehydrogenase family)